MHIAARVARLAGMRTTELALMVFPAVFPRLIAVKDSQSIAALAATASRTVKELVNQQGSSLLARGLYTGECLPWHIFWLARAWMQWEGM